MRQYPETPLKIMHVASKLPLGVFIQAAMAQLTLKRTLKHVEGEKRADLYLQYAAYIYCQVTRERADQRNAHMI
jgi:hypothetical protein